MQVGSEGRGCSGRPPGQVQGQHSLSFPNAWSTQNSIGRPAVPDCPGLSQSRCWALAYSVTASPGPTGLGGKDSAGVCVFAWPHGGWAVRGWGGARLKLKSGGKLFGSSIKNEI